jgi:hypothetical protein
MSSSDINECISTNNMTPINSVQEYEKKIEEFDKDMIKISYTRIYNNYITTRKVVKTRKYKKNLIPYIENDQCIKLDDHTGFENPCLLKDIIDYTDYKYYSTECSEDMFPFNTFMLNSIKNHESLSYYNSGELNIMGIHITNNIQNMNLIQTTLTDMFPNSPSLSDRGNGEFELYLPKFKGSLKNWKCNKDEKVYFDKYRRIGQYYHQWNGGIIYENIITKIQDIYDEYGYIANIFVIGADKKSSLTDMYHKYKFSSLLYYPKI